MYLFCHNHFTLWIVRMRLCSLRNGSRSSSASSTATEQMATSAAGDRPSLRSSSDRQLSLRLATLRRPFDRLRMHNHRHRHLVLSSLRLAATGEALLRESPQSSTRHQHSDRQYQRDHHSLQWNDNCMSVHSVSLLMCPILYVVSEQTSRKKYRIGAQNKTSFQCICLYV